jgi:DNA polymerase III subunit chi
MTLEKMKEVTFYHITSDPLEKSLAELANKLYEKKERTLIVCNDNAQMHNINNILWSFSTKKFIPHGSIEDDAPEQQPILLSTSPKNLDNNPSTIILLMPISLENAGRFEKYIYMFCGKDADPNVIAMNDLHAQYNSNNHYQIKYWFLDASKKWITR